MDFIIDNVDFFELPAQKYWTPPASKTPEQKKAEEEALKAFPDFINENGQLVNCSALRHLFIRGYDVGYNDVLESFKQSEEI